jgi:hypothetical protein
MSVNRREEILARLFVILSGITGIETAVRNRGLLDNDMCPAISLLDGDENSQSLGGTHQRTSGRGRQRMSPGIVTLHPQVFLLLKLKKPANLLVGETLNVFRGTIIKAIAGDGVLLSLITANGDITYDGCETDLKTGMEMSGQMQLSFSISHSFDPYA